MFANRFTAFVDACSLASVLRRNLLLTLAEAEFFRIRWSDQVLDETERATTRILAGKGAKDAREKAARARRAMVTAFDDAMVTDFEPFLCLCNDLPDLADAHVVAAALRTQAAVIVTENLRHFPAAVLAPLNIDARDADTFIADAIDRDPGRAVAAIRGLRERFKRPEKTAGRLLLDIGPAGLAGTVDVLKAYEASL